MKTHLIASKILPVIGLILAGIFLFSDTPEPLLRHAIILALILFSLHILISKSIINKLQKELDGKNELEDELSFLETTDEVTLLFNKRKIYEVLEYEMEKNKRYKSGLSIILCEIDDFSKLESSQNKVFINTFLRNFALQLTLRLRKSDIIARWSNHQFLVLIPNMGADETVIAAEKVRAMIESYHFDHISGVTTSSGVTEHIDADNKVSIVERAAIALNKAKGNGGNSVKLFS